MNLSDIIAPQNLRTALEPVVSIKRRAVVGLEAVHEALDGDAPVPIGEIRQLAQAHALSVDLDRLLRRKALEVFHALKEVPGAEAPPLLFLRFDASIVDHQGVVGSGWLQEQVSSLQLDPSRIVIDITESDARDLEALKTFLDNYRRHGFLVALSDVGSGHSNLTRIALAKPDVLKIGGALVRGLDGDYARQEIFKALMTLAHKMGALVSAEGVERKEEALAALELGADMIQGPFFGGVRPGLEERIAALAATHKTYSVEKNKAVQARFRDQDRLMGSLLKDLSALPPEKFEERLKEMAGANPAVECLFILDEKGIQITDTVHPVDRVFKRNSLFRPARRGADHSIKDYYYLLIDAFVNRFRTEPYISQASGNPCVTLSGLFRDAKNASYVLCVDLPIA